MNQPSPSTRAPASNTAPSWSSLLGLGSRGWIWPLLLAIFLLLLFSPFLQRMTFIAANANDWPTAFKNILSLRVSGDWSHALLIPFIGWYYISQRRPQLQQLLSNHHQNPDDLAPVIRCLFFFFLVVPAFLYYRFRLAPWNDPGLLLAIALTVFCLFGFFYLPAFLRRRGPSVYPLADSLLRFAGLFLFLICTFSYAWWLGPGRNDMFQGYSIILALFGLAMFIAGPAPMRVLWFPILYLFLAVKVSHRPWEALAWQLRLIASRTGEAVINLLGLPWDLHAELQGEGTTLALYHGSKTLPPMEVEDACSGLRMLMAFIALGVAMAFLGRKLWWQRAIMVALTLPIAVLINVGRIVTLAFVKTFGNPAAAAGDFHLLIGMFMLIPAALLFWLLGWVLDRMVIYDESSPPPSPANILPASSLPSRPTIFTAFILGIALAGLLGIAYTLRLVELKTSVFDLGLSSSTTQMLWALSLMAWLVSAVLAIFMFRRLRRRHDSPNIPRWALAVGMVLVSAIGLNSIVRASQQVLFKENLPLRKELTLLPDRVGSWIQIQEMPPMSEEQLQTLGTRQYIQRKFRDTSVSPDTPGAVVQLHVAYYTGTPDTVPHVPERCFVGGGLTPVGSPGRVTVNIQGDRYQPTNAPFASSLFHRDREPKVIRIARNDIPATIFTFGHPKIMFQQAVTSNVIYFFAANGKFLPTPDDVRLYGFDMRDRYSYYCKIEVLVYAVADREAALQRTAAFLQDALPEILACLPDWQDVLDGHWPLTKDPNKK